MQKNQKGCTVNKKEKDNQDQKHLTFKSIVGIRDKVTAVATPVAV